MIIVISTVLPLSPISNVVLPVKNKLVHGQTFKTTLSEGGGEGKHFCDYDCVSIPGKEEISTRFWLVSTSFVRDCSSRLKFSYIKVNIYVVITFY